MIKIDRIISGERDSRDCLDFKALQVIEWVWMSQRNQIFKQIETTQL